MKYAAQNGATDIELDGEKSFTFYAKSKTYKFKYTDGTWLFTAITGESITELDKEYPIVKKGDTGLDNIELKNLTAGAEYKVTLIHKDGFAYVKVEATGNVQEVELDKLTADELAKVTHIAGEMNSWNRTALTENSYLFKAGSKNDFLILDGTTSWEFKLGSAIIEELGVEYPLFKGGDNITFEEGVLTKGKNYLITVVIKESVVYVKVTEYTAKIEYVEKVYLQLNNSWYNSENRFAAYFFDGDTPIGWADLTPVDGKDGVCEVNVLSGASGVIFCEMKADNTTNDWGQKIEQTGNLTIPQKGDTKVVYSLVESAWKAENDLPLVDYTPIVDCGIVYTPEEGKIYLIPNSNWLQKGDGADPRFAVKFVDSAWSNQSDFIDMTPVGGLTNVYEVSLDQVGDFTHVQFMRMNGSTVENNWNNKYNNSATMELPKDLSVVCVIPDNAWNDEGDWFAFKAQ